MKVWQNIYVPFNYFRILNNNLGKIISFFLDTCYLFFLKAHFHTNLIPLLKNALF
ncbi:hypothetical protein MYP_1115 [Sporocytophaga myxococcoides]|uniref:Uncharacterized protein n=1 Tax=Sporocytophaga myxococcoides TaxID=153721 RepID=A0A098LBU1_9BACT|nr:hypothetical protein MYP_1115 [Sporocytophaga myxococcoides]